MRNLGWKVLLGVALAMSVTGLASCSVARGEEAWEADARQVAARAAAAEDRVVKGERLVTIGGCNHCHTPMKLDPQLGMPVPLMERRLSGHPEGAPGPSGEVGKGDQAVIGPTFTSFKAAFGTVYSANLTPDPETGLGAWTEEQFLRAMRTGQHRGESIRPILPPMPWENLAPMGDEDLRAIFAYLRSLPAVHNRVPEPQVAPEALRGIAAAYAKLAKK